MLSSQSFSFSKLLLLMFVYDGGAIYVYELCLSIEKKNSTVATLMECEVLNCSGIKHIFILSRLLSNSEKCFMFSHLIYWLDLWVSQGTAFPQSNHQICSAWSHGVWHQVADQECLEGTLHCSVAENLQTLIWEGLWFYSPQHYIWKGYSWIPDVALTLFFCLGTFGTFKG